MKPRIEGYPKAAIRVLLPLTLLAAGFAAMVAIVNPLRDSFGMDDGWAYARSVQHMLRTGEYRLSSWAAPNMPVQIYLAAGAAKVFGYSIPLMKLTTLLLLAVGLASFYALCRELRCSSGVALAATFGLLASPLVVPLSFTFMSDIQFMGWMILALALYVRGMRLRSDAWLLAGSAAAACAIGTRQFGIALPGAFVFAWMLSSREDRLPIRSLALALLLPACATVAQLYLGLAEPNFTQAARLREQHDFLTSSRRLLVRDMVWRSAISWQFVGICLLPVAPLLVWLGLSGKRGWGAAKVVGLTLVCSAAIATVLMTGSALTARENTNFKAWWVPLGLEWLLTTQLYFAPRAQRILDLLGLLSAGGLSAILIGSVPEKVRVRKVVRALRAAPELLLLMGTAALIGALHLIFVQYNDTYVNDYVPFALLGVALLAQLRSPPKTIVAASIAASVISLIAVSTWMRADLATQEARWKAADRLLAAGVPRKDIAGFRQWHEYHGAFDDWIAAGAPGYTKERKARPGLDRFHDPFYNWLDKAGAKAPYRVSNWREPASKWRVVNSDHYRDVRLRPHTMWTYAARPQATPAEARAKNPAPSKPATILEKSGSSGP